MFAISFSAAGILVAGVLAAQEPSGSSLRNVVLFVTDDQGLDAGCYGNEVVKTPNLDALAADGTVFTNAFCTTASCSASRSVILTGQFNHANGHYGHQHSYHKFSSYPNLLSLPVILAKAGYRTARIGKYHVAPEEVYKFDTVLRGPARNVAEMAKRAAPFVGAESERPFFLYICTSDPHRGGGDAKGLPGKPNRFGNKPRGQRFKGIEPMRYDAKDVVVPPWLPDTLACRAELAQYYQSVSRIDQGFGRLVTMLKEQGRYDDTLILYISDHGPAFPGAKTTVYEPGLRSPCVVRNPHSDARGQRSDALISWVDLVPTILDFCEIEAPNSHALHGNSFLAQTTADATRGGDVVFASHTFHEITMYYPMRVVRTRRYKLIWNIAHPLPYPFASDLWAAPTWQDAHRRGMDARYGPRTVGQYIHRAKFELYDIANDPYEARNLAGDPKHAKLLASLQASMKQFQRRTKDPWVLKWKYE